MLPYTEIQTYARKPLEKHPQEQLITLFHCKGTDVLPDNHQTSLRR